MRDFFGNYTIGTGVFLLVCVWGILSHACFLPPLYPVPPGDSVMINRLDKSSDFASQFFFRNNELQFGRDIDWAYGPFGFLKLLKYHPGTFYWGLIGRSFLALAFVTGCWRLISAASRSRLCLAIMGTLIAVVSLLVRGDPYFLGIVVLVGLNYFFRLTGRLTLDYLILVMACALVATVKVSFFSFASITIFVISISDIFQKKRIPWSLVVFTGGIVTCWALAGQKISNIFEYISVIKDQMDGYTDAMAFVHPIASVKEIILYVTSSSVFLIFYILSKKRAWIFLDFLPFGIVAMFLFVGFKHSFVRHDEHALDAANTLVFLLFVGATKIPPKSVSNLVYFTFGLYAALSVTTSAYIINKYKFSLPYSPSEMIFAPMREAKNLSDIIAEGTAKLDIAYEAEAASYQSALRLTPIIGPVDIYPDNFSVPVALNFSYSPRRGVVSHGIWNVNTLEQGAARLRSGQGPSTIFFDVDTIDSHYPSMDDGASWPALLTHYDIRHIRDAFLILEKRDTPRKFSIEHIASETTSFRQTIFLSKVTEHNLLWARIKIEKTLLGKLATFLFKTPEIGIAIKMRNGSEQKFRIIPDMVKAGFLLSPLINSRRAFWDLASESRRLRLKQNELASYYFFVQPFYGFFDISSLLFSNSIQLELYKFTFIHQSDKYFREIMRDCGGLESLYYESCNPINQSMVRFVRGPSGKRVLLAHAPWKFKMPVSFKMAKIRIGFGILEQAYTQGKTDGVSFRVSAIDADGVEIPLFRRDLKPLSIKSDRCEQTAVISVPGSKELEWICLETERLGIGTWDHSYWSNFAVDPKAAN